jgi:hypothetical protein
MPISLHNADSARRIDVPVIAVSVRRLPGSVRHTERSMTFMEQAAYLLA